MYFSGYRIEGTAVQSKKKKISLNERTDRSFPGNIFADILIIFITFSGLIFTSSPLVHWYKKYRLAATIADTVIGILYILLARYLVHVYNIKTDLFTFTVFAAYSLSALLHELQFSGLELWPSRSSSRQNSLQ